METEETGPGSSCTMGSGSTRQCPPHIPRWPGHPAAYGVGYSGCSDARIGSVVRRRPGSGSGCQAAQPESRQGRGQQRQEGAAPGCPSPDMCPRENPPSPGHLWMPADGSYVANHHQQKEIPLIVKAEFLGVLQSRGRHPHEKNASADWQPSCPQVWAVSLPHAPHFQWLW